MYHYVSDMLYRKFNLGRFKTRYCNVYKYFTPMWY